MANVTVAVPDELKSRMDKLDTVNWSAVARKAFEQHAADLEFIKEFTKNSTMTEEDAIRLGREVNRKVAERWRKEIETRRAAMKNGKSPHRDDAARR